MYIYHFHAQKQFETTITTVDGIAQMQDPILNQADYLRLKELIAETQKIEGGSKGLTICNLTLLAKSDARPSDVLEVNWAKS